MTLYLLSLSFMGSDTHRDHLVDIALWSCELCCVLCVKMYNEVEVVPQVVLPGDMEIKCDLLVLKLRPLQTWREGVRWYGEGEGQATRGVRKRGKRGKEGVKGR